MTRPIPALSTKFLQRFEQGPHGGFAAVRYLCPAGKPTIGYGHVLEGPHDPLWDATLDQAAADALAAKDLAERGAQLEGVLGMRTSQWLTENRFVALLDFVFNEGIWNFATSTMRHYVDIRDVANVAAQFDRWVYATVDGEKKPLPGLAVRRAKERAVWLEQEVVL